MRRYEVVYVAFDDMSAEELENQLERYLSIINEYKGTVVKVERWGKRKLAYLIQKRREGYYFLIDFAGDSAIVPEMERRMRIDDKILRYLSVKTDDSPDLAKLEEEISAIRKAEAQKQAAAEAADRESSETEVSPKEEDKPRDVPPPDDAMQVSPEEAEEGYIEKESEQ